MYVLLAFSNNIVLGWCASTPGTSYVHTHVHSKWCSLQYMFDNLATLLGVPSSSPVETPVGVTTAWCRECFHDDRVF